jgi:hypothetical protein
MDIRKLFGRIVERRENGNVDEFDRVNAEQIEAWLAKRAKVAGDNVPRLAGKRRPRGRAGAEDRDLGQGGLEFNDKDRFGRRPRPAPLILAQSGGVAPLPVPLVLFRLLGWETVRSSRLLTVFVRALGNAAQIHHIHRVIPIQPI